MHKIGPKIGKNAPFFSEIKRKNFHAVFVRFVKNKKMKRAKIISK